MPDRLAQKVMAQWTRRKARNEDVKFLIVS